MLSPPPPLAQLPRKLAQRLRWGPVTAGPATPRRKRSCGASRDFSGPGSPLGGSNWEEKTLAFFLRGVEKFNHQIETLLGCYFVVLDHLPFWRSGSYIDPINQKFRWNSIQEKSGIANRWYCSKAPRYRFHRQLFANPTFGERAKRLSFLHLVLQWSVLTSNILHKNKPLQEASCILWKMHGWKIQLPTNHLKIISTIIMIHLWGSPLG